MSQHFKNLSINPQRSETTIYSKLGSSSNEVSPRETLSQDETSPEGLNSGREVRLSRDNTARPNDRNQLGNLSNEIFDISPPGQRTLPKPPTIISNDLALAEAMNRPEWTNAIEKAREEADKMIREAEANKVRMVKPAGESFNPSKKVNPPITKGVTDVIDTIEKHKDTDRCDEVERIMSSHVDESLKFRIQRGEFIELHKLVFKDKSTETESGKMKVTNMDGETYYIPPSGEDRLTLVLSLTLESGKNALGFTQRFMLQPTHGKQETLSNIWMQLKMLQGYMSGRTLQSMTFVFADIWQSTHIESGLTGIPRHMKSQ